LKTELIVRLYDDLDDSMPVVLGKLRSGHFGEAFGLSTHDYEVMHSACFGF
jgi:hypothetical protein